MILFMFIIGAVFGSFYLVVATRLLRNEDIVFKSSYCLSCESKLKWYNLVPILSYLFQKGKCNKCHEKIGIEHIIVEITTGLLFAYMFHNYGLSYDLFMTLIISSLLVIISITDFKEMIILDSPLVVSIILMIALMFIYQDTNFLISSLVSGFAMFLMFLGIKKMGDIAFKKESLGGGDIKFAFVIGLSVGFHLSLYVLMISAFLALPTAVACILVTKNKEVPYGPFLVGALLLVYLNMDKFYMIV